MKGTDHPGNDQWITAEVESQEVVAYQSHWLTEVTGRSLMIQEGTTNDTGNLEASKWDSLRLHFESGP